MRLSKTMARPLKIFITAVLTLNFDFDLCWTSVPNFIKIGLVLLKKSYRWLGSIVWRQLFNPLRKLCSKNLKVALNLWQKLRTKFGKAALKLHAIWLIFGCKIRAPSHSRKPLQLAYDSLRLASLAVVSTAARKLWRLTAPYGGLANNLQCESKNTPPLNFF